MTRRTLDPEKLVKIHIYNNLLAYYSETCLSIFVPKRQRIFVPLSHFDVRVIHSRSDGTHKIANIYGSRDALPIPLYIISGNIGCHYCDQVKTRSVSVLLGTLTGVFAYSVHNNNAAQF